MTTARWLAVSVLWCLVPGCAGGEEDTYPTPPLGVSQVVYVAADADAQAADGSRDAPFASIQVAIDEIARGGAVLVSAGTYAENLDIHKPVLVLGSRGGDGPDAAAVVLEAPAEDAVRVIDAADVLVRGLRIVTPLRVGISVKDSTAAVEGCTIDGARPGADAIAYGISADESNLTVKDSAILNSAGAGMPLFGSDVFITDSEIRGNEGGGVMSLDTARMANLEVHASTIADNAGFGVAVWGGKTLLIGNEITSTRLGQGGLDAIADGVIAVGGDDSPGVQVTLEQNHISGNERTGVLFTGSVNGAILRNRLEGNASKLYGAGIYLQRGAGGISGVNVGENALLGNRYLGIGVNGARVVIAQNAVTQTLLGKVLFDQTVIPIGDAIGVFRGGGAVIERNQIQGAGRLGIVLDSPASGTRVASNTLNNNGDYGIVVQHVTAGGEAAAVLMNEVTGSHFDVVTNAMLRFVDVVDSEFLVH